MLRRSISRRELANPAPVPVDLSKATSYLSTDKAPRFLGQIFGDKMRKVLLASAASLVFCGAFAGAASANGISGTLSGSYANDTSSNGGDLWNVDGTLTGRFGGDWGLEAVGGYHSLDAGIGSNLDIWNVGGSAFWAGVNGRIAASINYYSTSVSGVDLHVTSYGARRMVRGSEPDRCAQGWRQLLRRFRFRRIRQRGQRLCGRHAQVVCDAEPRSLG